MADDDDAEEPIERPLVFVHGDVKTPPFSPEARRATGALLRSLQLGRSLQAPRFKAMPTIGSGCGELRIFDGASGKSFRIIVYSDSSQVVVLDVFEKKTQKTPAYVVANCRTRLRDYLARP